MSVRRKFRKWYFVFTGILYLLYIVANIVISVIVSMDTIMCDGVVESEGYITHDVVERRSDTTFDNNVEISGHYYIHWQQVVGIKYYVDDIECFGTAEEHIDTEQVYDIPDYISDDKEMIFHKGDAVKVIINKDNYDDISIHTEGNGILSCVSILFDILMLEIIFEIVISVINKFDKLIHRNK